MMSHTEVSMAIRISRRRFVSTVSAAALGNIAMPYLSRAADRPLITHGVQSGDVSTDSGVVWARTDRPSQMLVEVSTTESFAKVRPCRRSRRCRKATSPQKCCWRISPRGRTSSIA